MKKKADDSKSSEIEKKLKEFDLVYKTFSIKSSEVSPGTDFRQPSLLKYDGLKFFTTTTSQSK